jgi:hypothetical protein
MGGIILKCLKINPQVLFGEIEAKLDYELVDFLKALKRNFFHRKA